jgi:hypothetical protein
MVIQFTATIKRFQQQAEKTGWTYIKIPAALAGKLMPGNRKGFRVKGYLDDYAFNSISLLPMGGGDFILTLNGTVRKKIRKSECKNGSGFKTFVATFRVDGMPSG